jgi:hypothetical protein
LFGKEFRMRRVVFSIALVIGLSLVVGSAAAQSCSTLKVDGTGKPGTDLTFTLTGAAKQAPAILLVSPETGNLEIKLGPLGALSLGLALPIFPVAMARTDAQGDAKMVVKVPAGTIPLTTLYAQATTVGFSMTPPALPKLAFCTSNVEKFSVGE